MEANKVPGILLFVKCSGFFFMGGGWFAKDNRVFICQLYIPALSTHIVHTHVTFTFLTLHIQSDT